MRDVWTRFIAMAIGLALVGCAAVRPPMPALVPASSGRTVSLVLHPLLEEGRLAQATVNRYTVTSIDRLDVVPYVEVAANVFQPISSATGESTNTSDPQLLKLSRSAPINLNQAITFSHLKPSKRYRIFARAYRADGTLISTNDAYSYADVTLTNDDRPTMAANLPIKLVDVPFAATTQVTVSNSGGTGYDKVVTSLVSVVSGSEVAIAGTSNTIAKADIPKTLKLSGLQANTTYRLKVSARKTDDTEVATASVNVAVTTDDAPANAAVAFKAPAGGIAGIVTTIATGFPNPWGIARDSSGNLYVACAGDGTVVKVDTNGNKSPFASGLSTDISGIAVDGSGNVYVGLNSGPSIYKITPTGIVSNNFGSGLQNPYDLALGADGNLYVANGDGNDIKKIELPGGTTTTFYSQDQNGGPDINVSSVGADSNGNIYAIDGVGGLSLMKFSSNATILSDVSIAKNAVICTASDGTVYLADMETGYQVRMIPPIGPPGVLTGTGSPGSADGGPASATFKSMTGIVYDPTTKALYVVDNGNGSVRKIE